MPKAFPAFDGAAHMRPFSEHEGVVDVMEERRRFTLLVRDRFSHLADRYGGREDAGPKDVDSDLDAIAMRHDTIPPAAGGAPRPGPDGCPTSYCHI